MTAQTDGWRDEFLTGGVLREIWPRLPSYLKVYAELVRALRAGEYPPGTALPTRRALCDRYGVSRITVAQATRMLVEAGLVEDVRRGKALRIVAMEPGQRA